MNILYALLLFVSLSFSQIQHGGSPKYISLEDNINFVKTNKDKVINNNLHPMVLKYAHLYEVDINFPKMANKKVGKFETTFILGFESVGAKALAFEFDEFFLTENSKMFIYDEDKTMFIGSFNSNNNNLSGVLSTAVVKSDRVIIELTIPNKEIINLKLNIRAVTHDFLDLMNFHSDEEGTREDCNDNVACSSANDWGDQVDAVVLITGNGGSCSAAVVNNTEFDKTPYILYAAHCNSGGSSTVYFNYQASSCNGSNAGNYNTMSGTQNLAIGNFGSNDYALIRLNNNIPDSYGVYYAGWNKSSSNPGNNVVGIHHPDAGIKKISYDANGMSSSGNAWDFRYSSGRVIPGSSGSPFFDSNKRIRGMASYIYTDYCSPAPDCYCAQTYYHGYAKFSSGWQYMDNYLDPNNSGVTFIDGTRDGNTDIYGCMDSNAENYNDEATVDDGSCYYSYGNADFSFGSISGDNIQVVMSNSVPVGGFQFTLGDDLDLINLTGASGGAAAENGFEVSTSDLGIVLGFSFTGSVIPSGTSVLTNLSYTLEGSGNTLACIENPVASDQEANPLTIDTIFCENIDFASGNASYSFGNITNNTLEVYLNNSAPVSGFQFILTDSPNLVTLTGASGGAAAENGFEVSTSELGIVIGFSFTGGYVPIGSGLLTTLNYTSIGSGTSELCISDAITSDINGGALLSSGDCTFVEVTDLILGDINADTVINVQDVVILINVILGDDDFTNAGDLNSDGVNNVQDVVILIGIILE